jgi:hypothetical protein
MKYTFLSMGPIDEFDSAIKVQATPSRLEEMLGRKKRILKYYGSGTTWRRGENGPHCNFITCEWLHRIWSTELKRAHDARNFRRRRDVAEDALGSR